MTRRWHVTGGPAGLAPPLLPTPPGQDALDWRLGRWAQFRSEMLARLRAVEVPAATPERGSWQPYADLAADPMADWVSALVDAWAEVGDVLSFYQERLLNEGFLRTAREPASLDMLLGVVGARRGGAVSTPSKATLDPGCAATAWFILTMHEGRGLPTRALLPAGSAIRHVEMTSQRPILFETDHALTVRREWNALSGWVPPPPPPRQVPATVRGLRLADTQPGVEPAAHLLLTGQGAGGAPVRMLRTAQSLTALRPLGVSELVLAPVAVGTADGTVDQPRLYAFDRQAAIFGADAPALDSLPRPRRLEQGIMAGGLFLLPPDSADLPDPPWQAMNQDIPTGSFTAVQPLAGGDILLSTSDGLMLRTRLDAAWTPSRGGLTQRGLQLLCDDGKGGVLAGGPAGGAFRSDDPRRGWNSLAGGYVLDKSGKQPAASRAALPAEQVRRLLPVDTFPGGGGILALTDSGLFLRRQAGAWLSVRLTRLLAGTDKDMPSKFADAVMGATGHVVAVCHDGGIERLGVKDAILPPSPGAAADPASKAKPPAPAKMKRPSVLRRVLGWLGHALMLPGMAGRMERQVGLAARTLWQATRREWQKIEAADGRLWSLGTRKPHSLVPLSDRLGEGDLLVATDQGCVLYDQLDRLWNASTGLPTRSGGAVAPVRQMLGFILHGTRTAVALVDPADDGTGGGVYLYNSEDRSWTSLRTVSPADGPATLGVSASGWLAFAQTPTPVAEWPDFALGGPAPPDAGEGQPVLDLDAPGLALAPGSWLVLRDPDSGRIAAMNVIRAWPVQANAFARNRRVARVLLDVPDGLDLADFPRRTSLVLAASRELPLAGGALLPPQPVGLTAGVCLAGLATGLDDPGLVDDAVPVREVPGHRPARATPPAGRQGQAVVKPVVLTGKPARVAPLLLGGVQVLTPGVVTRPPRALTGYDLLTLGCTQAALWALDAAGRLMRSDDQGMSWQPDAIGVPDGIGPVTLTGHGDVLWLAGKGGVAWRRDGDAGWTPGPALPVGYVPACLLPDGQGGAWVGGPSGLLTLGGTAGWARCGGGDLDPGACVTALALLDDGTLAVGTDGDGVLLRALGQPGWIAANDGLGSGRVTALSTQGGRMLAGTLDAGGWLRAAGATAWQPVTGGATRVDAVLLTPTWLAVAGDTGLVLRKGTAFDQDIATGAGLLGDLSCLLSPAADRLLTAGRLRWTAIADADPLLSQQDLFDLPATEADLLDQGLVGPVIRQLFKDAQDTVPDDAVTIRASAGWALTADDWCRLLLPVPGGLRALRPGPAPSAMGGAVDGQGRWTLTLAAADGSLCPLLAWPDDLILRPADDKDAAQASVRHVVAADILGDGMATALTLDGVPGLALDPDSVTLHANVVAASQGESVLEEVLGNGDPDRETQYFPLQRTPLVFLPGDGPGARQSTLTVSVDGQGWQEVGDFAASGPTDRCYRVIVDSTGRTNVLFGDGRHGARPSPGTGNVRASYRAGMGPVPDPGPLNRQPSGGSSFSHIVSGMAGMAKDVRMLLNSPAVPPEQASVLRLDLAARAMAPAGRLITLADHVRMIADDPDVAGALAAPGVGTGADARPLISVAPAAGVEVGALIERLRGELRAAQPVGGRIPRLLPAQDRPVRLVASIWWRGDVPDDAAGTLSRRLLDGFGASARGLGCDLSAAEILSALQGASGVAGAEILLLHPVGSPPALCPLITAHAGTWPSEGAPQGADHVYLSDGAGHLLLRLSPARGFAPLGIDPVTGHG